MPKVPEFWCSFFSNTKLLIFGNFYFIIEISLNSFILKRLKTGVQWRELPIESYFEKGEISWQNVYYYFNKWSKDGSFQRNIKPNPRNGEQPDVYFDEELYKNRFKIEQANGWLDGYKGLIMRYEYLDVTWIGMLLLGFISKFLKKV